MSHQKKDSFTHYKTRIQTSQFQRRPPQGTNTPRTRLYRRFSGLALHQRLCFRALAPPPRALGLLPRRASPRRGGRDVQRDEGPVGEQLADEREHARLRWSLSGVDEARRDAVGPVDERHYHEVGASPGLPGGAHLAIAADSVAVAVAAAVTAVGRGVRFAELSLVTRTLAILRQRVS